MSRALLLRWTIPGKRRAPDSATSKAMGMGKVTVSPIGGLEARALWLLSTGWEGCESLKRQAGARLPVSCDMDERSQENILLLCNLK